MNSRQFHFGASVALVALCAGAPAFAQTAPAPAERPAGQTAPQPLADRSNELVVKGARSDVIASPDRTSFNVANDLNVQTGTLADALRAVPGVEVDLQGNVSLRGDSGVTILVDGRPSAIMRSDARGDYLLATPASQIERVEVITNPSAAFSPEGSGGVINLVTRQVKRDARFATLRGSIGNEGRAALNTTGAWTKPGLSMTGDLGNRRSNNDGEATQMRSRLDSAGNLVTSQQDSTLDAVVSSRNGRLGVDYDPDKKNRISGELTYRDGRADSSRADHFTSSDPAASYDRTSDNDAESHGYGVRGSWRRTLPGNGHELVVDASVDKNRFERVLDGATDPTLVTLAPTYEHIRNAGERTDYGFKVDYKKALKDGPSLNIGYELDMNRNEFDYSGARGAAPGALVSVPSLTNRFDFDQAVHAFYGTYAYELGKFQFQPGLRLEQAEITINQVTNGVKIDDDYFRAYPTMHIGYELSAKQTLRASYSRRIQRPSPQDLNPYTLYLDPLNLRRGNPNLRPEVTDSFELAWQKRDGGTFYSLTGFYRTARGGVTDVVQDLGNGVFLSTRANLATAKRAGVEAIANGKLSKKLSYNAAVTFLWNEIDPRFGGVPTPRSGTTGTARVNLTWQPNAKDYFQLNGFYAGKQLVAQGYRESGGMLNFGYRRKFNEKLSLVVTAQNLLDSARQKFVIDTPAIHDRISQKGIGRIFMLTLSYTLGNQGGRRRPDAGIDFDPGAGAVPQ